MPDDTSVPRPIPALTVDAMRALLGLIEHGSYSSAANAVGQTRSKLTERLAMLSRAFGRDLFTGNNNRMIPTPFANELAVHVLSILQQLAELKDADAVKPHTRIGFLPHHAEFMGGFIRESDGDAEVQIDPRPLQEPHRSKRTFQLEALEKLIDGDLDVVVGPPPDNDADLCTHLLYRTHIVALVRSDAPRVFEIADYQDEELLLPPAETRAGSLIRDALTEVGAAPRIRLSTFSTKVLVILAIRSGGLALVPGDIAFAFSRFGTLPGRAEADRTMKWVPVEKNGARIEYGVHATALRGSHAPDPKIVRTLKLVSEAVDDRYQEDTEGEFVELAHVLTEEGLLETWHR